MKHLIIALIAASALAASVRPAGAALDKQETGCAAEDMQLLYYYLAPSPDAKVKDRPTSCHPGKASLQIPAWLEKAVPAMAGRKLWKDPEEGEISEAALWQTPVSILYEFSSRLQKIAVLGSEDPLALEADFNDMRIRFVMSVDRISKSNLETSFEGRGGPMLGTLDNISRDFDELTEAVSKADRKGFDLKAAELMRRSRDLFAQFFEAPRKNSGKKPAVRYSPEARVLPGYRGVSLPLSGSQALFVAKGDRVDMLVTFEAIMGEGPKEKVTATILQNVLVTGVRKPANAGETGVVQLLCNPNEAQYAALSLAQGSNINLVRRAPGDFEMRPMEIASFRKLIK